MYNELYHHGIVGMKWGVRRSPSQLSRAGGSKKKSSSGKDAAKKQEPSRKSAKSMTDEELKAKINRKRLENDYNSLYPEKVSTGKKFANAVLNKVILPAATDAGKQLATDFLKQQGQKVLASSVSTKK